MVPLSGIAFFAIPYTLYLILNTSYFFFMSFLYHHRTRKIIKYTWGVVAVLIIIGMVVFFAPGLIPGVGY